MDMINTLKMDKNAFSVGSLSDEVELQGLGLKRIKCRKSQSSKKALILFYGQCIEKGFEPRNNVRMRICMRVQTYDKLKEKW